MDPNIVEYNANTGTTKTLLTVSSSTGDFVPQSPNTYGTKISFIAYNVTVNGTNIPNAAVVVLNLSNDSINVINLPSTITNLFAAGANSGNYPITAASPNGTLVVYSNSGQTGYYVYNTGTKQTVTTSPSCQSPVFSQDDKYIVCDNNATDTAQPILVINSSNGHTLKSFMPSGFNSGSGWHRPIAIAGWIGLHTFVYTNSRLVGSYNIDTGQSVQYPPHGKFVGIINNYTR
jgi:hypothetical protein